MSQIGEDQDLPKTLIIILEYGVFFEGCGVVPTQRDINATHEIASFNSLEESVDYYMFNINRSYAYEELRQIREKQRNDMMPIKGIVLAEGLGNYAFPGNEYIDSIKSVIQYNQLGRHDYTN